MIATHPRWQPVIAMIPFFKSRLHENTILAAGFRSAALAGVVGLLGGCGTLGSATIVGSRTPVNEAVATTARQQTLMNIVRVYHNEAPLILDVVEADEMVTVGASPTGGASGIGAIAGTTSGTLAGRTESASGMVTASDGVTNRYVPLQGQALHSQLSTPITVETVNALYDSDWPLQSILDFAYDRITPSAVDRRLAIDLLTFLDNSNEISLATTKSGFSKEDPLQQSLRTGNVTINTQQTDTGGGDTLNIYKGIKSKYHVEIESKKTMNNTVWSLFSSLYNYSQPNTKGKLLSTTEKSPALIELRNSPRTHLTGVDLRASAYTYLGPVARTRTAVGILKYLVTQPKIAFIDILEYQSIRHENWNSDVHSKKCGTADYYILNPMTLIGSQSGDKELYYDINNDKDFRNFRPQVSNFLRNLQDDDCSFDYTSNNAEGQVKQQEIGNFAVALGGLERNILIVRSTYPISGASTSWNDGNQYYSVMSDDLISQRNLMLVSQFLTIQATSTPSPSLTTISPSGR